MNFVSEKELNKKREENPEAETDEPVDNRPLFNRLKEMKDKKQLEYDETHALKNQFASTRGMDDGDADFLSQVDRIKDEQEARKRHEEQELLRLAREQSASGQAIVAAAEPKLDRPQKVPKQGTSKQANLVSTLVRKRPRSSSTEGGDEKCSNASSCSQPATVVANPSTDSLPNTVDDEAAADEEQSEPASPLCKMIGIIPGVIDYSDSSDDERSSSNSESLESQLPTVAVYAGKGVQKKQ